VPDNTDPVLAVFVAEMRALLEDVKAERRALFQIMIKHGDLPMLLRLADYLEEQDHGTVLQ
jgi:hypothetical protein